jgi:hypothetical protein
VSVLRTVPCGRDSAGAGTQALAPSLCGRVPPAESAAGASRAGLPWNQAFQQKLNAHLKR